MQMLKRALIAYVNSIKAVWSAIIYPLAIVSKRKGNVKDYRIYGNSIQDGTPTPENPIEVQSVGELVTEGEYTGKYKVPIEVRGKNLLNVPKISRDYYTSYEQNGDLITIKGRVPGEKYSAGGGYIKFAIPNNKNLPSGEYTFSVNITLLEAGDFGADLRMYSGSASKPTEKYTDWRNITLNKKLRISCSSKYTNGFNSATIRINGCKVLIDVGSLQIEKRLSATDYEPYIEPQTVNIYLDEPLKTGEVIQKSTDNLPALPQFKGTTIYEVQTAVPPSGIEVCYYE